jgi:argininosuccinate lyase
MLLATDLAERLVAGGMPFREAHELVGRLVYEALQTGSTLRDIARASVGPDAAAGLDAQASVDSRHAPGPSAPSVEAQLSHLDASLKQIRDALG